MNNKNLRIIISKKGYAYNYIFKARSIDDKFETVSQDGMMPELTINKILSGKYVLLERESRIDNLMMAMSSLPLYKSKSNYYLGFASMLLRKIWNDPIKEKIIIMYEN